MRLYVVAALGFIICCRSGRRMGQQKVQNLLNGADLIASSNPGCTMQCKHLGLQNKQIPIMHPMELLDCSIRGLSFSRRKYL